MTAIVVAAQGTGITDRTKTCIRASTKAKERLGERQRMISYRRADPSRPSIQTRGVQLAISMSETVIGPPRSTLAGEGRGRHQLHADLVPPQRRLIQPDRGGVPSFGGSTGVGNDVPPPCLWLEMLFFVTCQVIDLRQSCDFMLV